MHLIWKRPDGFHNALPADFRRVALSNGAQLWLHRHEHEWYPFQISGDWSGEQDTQLLNGLVNLLDEPADKWVTFFERRQGDDFAASSEDMSTLIRQTLVWLKSLEGTIKGTKWEVDIVRCALGDLHTKIQTYCHAFLEQS